MVASITTNIDGGTCAHKVDTRPIVKQERHTAENIDKSVNPSALTVANLSLVLANRVCVVNVGQVFI